MSNFTFLTSNWPDLYATASEAEQNVTSTPLRLRSGQALSHRALCHQPSCFYTRRSLEIAVKWLYANDSYLKKPYADNLSASLSPIFPLQLSTTNKILTA